MSYKEDVLAVFNYLYVHSWPAFLDKDFWHTANTLDTCVDFLIEGSNAWKNYLDEPLERESVGLSPRERIQRMIEKSHEYFRDVYLRENGAGQSSPNVWWDDYGWWGIAFTKICQNFPAIY